MRCIRVKNSRKRVRWPYNAVKRQYYWEAAFGLSFLSCGFTIRLSFSLKPRSDSSHSSSLAICLNLSNWVCFSIMRTYDIFIDESSQTKHKHILLGGLVVQRDLTFALNAMLEMACSYYNISREAKWTKVSKRHLPAYRALVDTFFKSPEYITPCHFHVNAIESARQNHSKFNEGNKEIGFNKEIYQLILKFVMLYPDGIYHIHLDYRDTSSGNDELRRILNNGIYRRFDRSDRPVRRVQMRKSHDVLALQLVDILLGGVGYQLNGHIDKDNASQPKSSLSRHITDLARINDIKSDTSKSGKFTLWHRQFE